MAVLLCKLGRFAYRRRWLVTVLWAGVLVLAGVMASRAPEPPPDDFSVPGTEVQRAYEMLDESFPALNADGGTARVVFKTHEGKVTDAEPRRAVEETLGKLSDAPQVGQVTDPFAAKAVSRDGSTAYAQVSYEVPAAEVSDAARDTLLESVEDARSADLTVEAGGNVVSDSKAGHSAEMIGLAVAAVVLALTFGALIAAGLPLLTALLGVAVAICSIKALAEPLGLSGTTSALATMLGLAVGIDYALFVVSRYRDELARGRSRKDAAGLAVGTAGSAVLFAGLTVIIALAGLSVVGIPVLTKMGLAAAGTVGLAVLIALTLVPALLGIAGKRVGPARARRGRGRGRKRRSPAASGEGGAGQDGAGRDAPARPGLGVRWPRFVTRRPLAVLLLGFVGLGALAVPAASLEMGLPGDGSKAESTTQRRAYDLLAEGFGPGFNGPLLTVVQAEGGGDARTAAKRVAADIEKMDGVAAVTPPRVNDEGDTAVLNVIPATGPESGETAELVHTLREPELEQDSDAGVLVSGATAMSIDVSQKLTDALIPYLGLVVGLAFLLLIAVFRSLLVPLKAALGFLLSIVAALGAVVAVFQWGWLAPLFGVAEPGPVISIMPIFMIGVVFGLAMDYEVFLVTRMREGYVRGLSPRDAVLSGFEHSARAVTAAALIMISVFAGFIGSGEQMIKTIGFGLAAAVVLDAFVVRMTLVPAVLVLLGPHAWRLPRWLDRITPNLDVEGEKLHAEQGPDAAPASGRTSTPEAAPALGPASVPPSASPSAAPSASVAAAEAATGRRA